MIAPIAATVATAGTDTAPNIIQARMVTIPREPVIPPIQLFAAPTKRLEIPPLSIMLPQIMKNGKAIMDDDATPV